jgi:hypothetical protein
MPDLEQEAIHQQILSTALQILEKLPHDDSFVTSSIEAIRTVRSGEDDGLIDRREAWLANITAIAIVLAWRSRQATTTPPTTISDHMTRRREFIWLFQLIQQTCYDQGTAEGLGDRYWQVCERALALDAVRPRRKRKARPRHRAKRREVSQK